MKRSNAAQSARQGEEDSTAKNARGVTIRKAAICTKTRGQEKGKQGICVGTELDAMRCRAFSFGRERSETLRDENLATPKEKGMEQ